MINSSLDLNFDVIHAATNDRYGDGCEKSLVSLGPIAPFSNSNITTSRRKHLEDFSHTLIVSLLYKLLTRSRAGDYLYVGFERGRNIRQRELTKSKL